MIPSDYASMICHDAGLDSAVVNRLLVKAVIAFLALPGVVAFAVPLWLKTPRELSEIGTFGGLLIAVGFVLLLWCIRDFYVSGKGTLAPWSPPQELVVSGLYQWCRNPMYVAVMLVLGGWAVGYGSTVLGLYALLVMLSFHLRVVLGEEPWLASRYGDRWTRYKATVPRWFGGTAVRLRRSI